MFRTLALFIVALVFYIAAPEPIRVPTTVRLDGSTVTYTVPFYFLQKQYDQWRDIEQKMVSTNASTIILNWNGGGGYVSMGNEFIRYMKIAQHQGKTIRLVISNTAISEHAMVVCEANSYKILNGGTLHYHAAFVRDSSTHRKIYTDTADRFSDCESVGILSSSEVNLIVNGHRRIVITSDGHHTLANDWDIRLPTEAGFEREILNIKYIINEVRNGYIY